MCTLRGNLADFELRRSRVDVARRHCEEGIGIAEKIGSAHTLLVPHGNLAHTLVLQGEFAEAASFYRRSLIGCRQRGLMQQVGIRMWGLACCATGVGDYSRAALLHGAAESVVSQPRLYPIEDRLRRDDQARLRHVLGDLEFDQGYRAGRALSFEDAIDLTLTRPGEGTGH